MGMTGEYRQASPRVLELIRSDPDLVRAVLEYEPSSGDGEPLPPRLRALAESLPEHARAGFEASAREQMRAAMDAAKASPLWPLLAGRRSAASAGARDLAAAGVTAADLPGALFIDKAWHGLHYLLTGDVGPVASPLGDAVLGGTEVGEDLGYGPARVLAPEAARAAADALDAFDDGEISTRFDAAAMTARRIYPEVWDEPREELVGWMVDTLRDVRAYYAGAREKGYGMLLVIA